MPRRITTSGSQDLVGMLAGNYGKLELPSPRGNPNRRGQMISSYPPAIRRQLLSKHFLISTLPERALDDLVKFTTVARFEPHRVIFSKGLLRHPVGPRTDLF